MKQVPLISVVVPVYNVEKWLKRCVDSICGQVYKKLEIILVDDGSTDSSGELCEQFAMLDSRIKVIHKENGGLSDARNIGLSQANGEYISFIDSDDWIEKNFIEYLFKLVAEYECEVAGCAYRKCEDICEKVLQTSCQEVKIYEHIDVMSALIDNMVQQVVWNKLYKKSVIEDIIFPKGKYHEDEFWSYQVFARINKYVESNYIGYNYFQRENSIMGEKYSLKRLDVVEAKVQRQKYLEGNLESLASKGRINLFFTCMYHGQLALRQLENKEIQEALYVLCNIMKKHRLQAVDYRNLPLTHKIWGCLARYSFVLTCRVRNCLKIGL